MSEQLTVRVWDKMGANGGSMANLSRPGKTYAIVGPYDTPGEALQALREKWEAVVASGYCAFDQFRPGECESSSDSEVSA